MLPENSNQVDHFPYGEALDRLVAEMVLGQVACDRWWIISTGVLGTSYIKGKCSHANCYPQEQCPHYSTEWGAAKEVVNAFRFGRHHQGNLEYPVACVIEMVVSDWGFEDGDCLCKIYSPSLAPCVGTGSEMPLAICRAALKVALGV